MAQVPLDVQADQILNDVLGAANNVPPAAADPQDAVVVNQAAPAAPAEAQDLVSILRLYLYFANLNLSSVHDSAAGSIHVVCKVLNLCSVHVLAAGAVIL